MCKRMPHIARFVGFAPRARERLASSYYRRDTGHVLHARPKTARVPHCLVTQDASSRHTGLSSFGAYERSLLSPNLLIEPLQ